MDRLPRDAPNAVNHLMNRCYEAAAASNARVRQSMTRIAVISDVHGNKWALEAVFKEIDARGISRIVNLGDCVYGPLEPGPTAAMLMSREIPTVRGNEDRIIVEGAAQGSAATMVSFARQSMTAEQIDWLAGLPLTAVIDGSILMCHGTPARDDEYLLQSVDTRGARRRTDEDIAARLRHIETPVVLCGHDHTPGMEKLGDGRIVVNPGSVGLQAYEDDTPMPHVMQTGSPHARLCVLTKDEEAWSVEFVEVAYDWDAAAKTAEAHGRPDWAALLRTGHAR